MNTKENIDTARIQTELCRLFKSHSEETKIKASLFNLVVYTNETSRTASCFKEIINQISEQFPYRLIFIQADSSGSSDKLQVRVLPAASNSTGGVAGDQIWIEVSGSELSRVPFLILPHLIPDLPIYLLWGQDPTKEEIILPKLLPLATRIIFDSENANNLQQFSSTILQMINTSTLEIVDMNWIRISGWRQILGRAFDSETRIHLLHTTTYIKLIYNDLPNSAFSQPETQALYLQAWIASCLDWKLDEIEHQEKKTILYYQAPHGPAQIHLVPHSRQDLPAEEIVEIEMSSPNNYNCLFCRINTQQVSVKASSQYQCLLPFNLFFPTLQSGKSLMQEIFYQRISNHYRGMLRLISQGEGTGSKS